MALFRDEDILRYLHNEMEYTEVADFEATLDALPDMQDRFEEILDELAWVQNVDNLLSEDSLHHILSFALSKRGIDDFTPTRQAYFYPLK